MSAEDSTPCQEAPEAWVGDDHKLRAQAAKDCARCPLHMFAACQRLAAVDPFGVMAGIDHGVKFRKATSTPNIADIKECEECGTTIHRGKRGKGDWLKLRYCGSACYALNRTVKGLPEFKECELCGGEFGRGGRSVQQWKDARFCGVKCSVRARNTQVAS